MTHPYTLTQIDFWLGVWALTMTATSFVFYKHWMFAAGILDAAKDAAKEAVATYNAFPKEQKKPVAYGENQELARYRYLHTFAEGADCTWEFQEPQQCGCCGWDTPVFKCIQCWHTLPAAMPDRDHDVAQWAPLEMEKYWVWERARQALRHVTT